VESSGRDSEVDAHKVLLTMVDRSEAGADGFIVRTVLPFGRVLYPCDHKMLMLEETFLQGDRPCPPKKISPKRSARVVCEYLIGVEVP
jgi:hypothetical protein